MSYFPPSNALTSTSVPLADLAERGCNLLFLRGCEESLPRLRELAAFDRSQTDGCKSCCAQNRGRARSHPRFRRVESAAAFQADYRSAWPDVAVAKDRAFSVNVRRSFVVRYARISLRNGSAKSFSFCSPTPAIRRNSLGVCRIISRHFPERYVGKDDVRRHVAFIGKLTAQRTQTLEQRFIALDRADSATRCFLGDIDLLGQRN